MQRKKLGLLFEYSEGWIGGSYYFLNMVSALNHLPNEIKPEIIILTDNRISYNKMLQTGYPYLSQLPAHFDYLLIERGINKLTRILTGKDLINKKYKEKQLPVLFGYYEQLLNYKCKKKLYWIPDLQDCYYPEYLGKDIALSRKKKHAKLAYSKSNLVFSSNASMEDFEKFYPSSCCKKYVIPFAVSLPVINNINPERLLQKHGLPENYFFSPNQFWSHKNHLTVIKAVEILAKKNNNVYVVFTGNENTGNGKYAQTLKLYVKEHGLESHIKFLGFIERAEQLTLMLFSKAIIQPSLFEGWSTVIEDAKALNKFVIASDLKVHYEQLKTNAFFFNPENPEQLASAMQNSTYTVSHYNYELSIKNYAQLVLKTLDDLQ